MNECLENEFEEELNQEKALLMVSKHLKNNIDHPVNNSSMAVFSKNGLKELSNTELENLFKE